MFIAMNRFRVAPGSEDAFETIWKTRERRLTEMKGYIEFHMLKGPKAEDHTLYASHTVWESQEDFKAWTQSEQFRAAHAKAGENRGKVEYLGPPQFEGFEVFIHDAPEGAKAAAE